MGGTRFWNFGYQHYAPHLPLAWTTFDENDSSYDSEDEHWIEDDEGNFERQFERKEAVKTAMQRVSRDTVCDYLRVRLLLEATVPRYNSQVAWALCNLSRKAYVRATPLATLTMPRHWQTGCSVDGPFVKGIHTVVDLGTVALILSSWSGDLSNVGIVGPWAGDRLAVAAIEELGAGWEDVSEMGMELVKQCVSYNSRGL